MSKGRSIPQVDAAEAWQDVLSRAFQGLSFYHWFWAKTNHPVLNKDLHSVTLENAALESSLMSVRDLDDFFGSTSPKPDDISANDFGYGPAKRFLSQGEREGINKKLAHLTYRSVHERRAQPVGINPKTWNYSELINRAMGVFLAFLDYLEASFFVSNPAELNLVRNARTTIKQSLANLNALTVQAFDFNA